MYIIPFMCNFHRYSRLLHNLEPRVFVVERETLVRPDHVASKNNNTAGMVGHLSRFVLRFVEVSKNTVPGNGRELHCTRAVS